MSEGRRAAMLFTALFPMNKDQFDIVKKEIARRKGLDSSVPTPEEIAVCERVTGFAYKDLWNKDNAFKFRSSHR